MTVWRVGMKAVCIGDGPWVCSYDAAEPFIDGPVEDEVCLVIGLGMIEGVTGLLLEGYNNSENMQPYEAQEFRPAVDHTATVEAIKRKAIDAAANAPADAVSEGVE